MVSQHCASGLTGQCVQDGVNITGRKGFDDAGRPRFGRHRAQVLFAAQDTIWVISPPGTGTVTVTVTVGGVSSQATAATEFTYQGFIF